MDHDLSVHTVSSSAEEHDSAARSCPFGCRVLRHAAGEGWYRHVGHHMEDIRLLALPPSLRLPNDDFEGGVSGSSSNGLENPLEPFHMGGVSMIIEEESERSESVALDDGELKAQSQDNSSPWSRGGGNTSMVLDNDQQSEEPWASSQYDRDRQNTDPIKSVFCELLCIPTM
jgi:hypothetical protein